MTSGDHPRLLVVADSDSYLKWGVSRAVEARDTWDVELVVVRNAVTPSESQRHAAVDGRLADPELIGYPALVERLRSDPPDILLLACRGPLIQLLLEETFAGEPPCAVTLAGIPGIWMPPTRLGLELRAAVDLMIVHSRRERRHVEEAQPLGNLHATGLASLIEADPVVRADVRHVVFAPQALVPRSLEQRRDLLRGLVATARAHPEVDVVIKLRGQEGEAQTHAEFASFPELLEELAPSERPANLRLGFGPMREHLEACAGFVTVSSTAALEAVAAGVPTLCLEDFGVGEDAINVVFEGSGLFGTLDDLAALRFRDADPEWMRDNYFHGHDQDDWIQVTARLLAERSGRPRPTYRAPRRGPLGALSRARRRYEALGAEDTAARRLIGGAARAAARAARGARDLSRRGTPSDAITLSPSS